MRIMRVMDDPTRPASAAARPPTFVNTSSHWWDASQIYGQSLDYQTFVRAGHDGKLRVEPDGSLPLPPGKTDGNPTEEPGFWIGLAMLQTLFTYEHNAVCDMLRGNYPTWNDEEVFQRARLDHRRADRQDPHRRVDAGRHQPPDDGDRAARQLVRVGGGAACKNVFGRISSSEVISGIPGAATEHYGVPYSLTEEFVAVYRMHPLAPDDWSIRALADDRTLGDCTLRDLSGPGGIAVLGKTSMPDLFYSFGTLHPGPGQPAQLPTVPAGVRATRRQAAWTSRPPTSCDTARWASRATASSAGCCTSTPRRRSRSSPTNRATAAER